MMITLRHLRILSVHEHATSTEPHEQSENGTYSNAKPCTPSPIIARSTTAAKRQSARAYPVQMHLQLRLDYFSVTDYFTSLVMSHKTGNLRILTITFPYVNQILSHITKYIASSMRIQCTVPVRLSCGVHNAHARFMRRRTVYIAPYSSKTVADILVRNWSKWGLRRERLFQI